MARPNVCGVCWRHCFEDLLMSNKLHQITDDDLSELRSLGKQSAIPFRKL